MQRIRAQASQAAPASQLAELEARSLIEVGLPSETGYPACKGMLDYVAPHRRHQATGTLAARGKIPERRPRPAARLLRPRARAPHPRAGERRCSCRTPPSAASQSRDRYLLVVGSGRRGGAAQGPAPVQLDGDLAGDRERAEARTTALSIDRPFCAPCRARRSIRH